MPPPCEAKPLIPRAPRQKKRSVEKHFYKTNFCKIRKGKKRAVFNDDQGVVVQNILRNILLPTYAKEKSNF